MPRRRPKMKLLVCGVVHLMLSPACYGRPRQRSDEIRAHFSDDGDKTSRVHFRERSMARFW